MEGQSLGPLLRLLCELRASHRGVGAGMLDNLGPDRLAALAAPLW